MGKVRKVSEDRNRKLEDGEKGEQDEIPPKLRRDIEIKIMKKKKKNRMFVSNRGTFRD